METAWIASPMSFVVLLAAGLTGCLALFACLKKEIGENEDRRRKDHEELDDAQRHLRAVLAELRTSIEELETLRVPPSPAGNGMNMNKRVQALRMCRRGERPEQISAALGIPQNEVNLLLKVHRIVVGPL